MSYIYARKDLAHIGDPQEETLLKAFFTALYDPNYINLCVEKFAFTAVPDNVRTIGLAGIDMLASTANATDWTFESSTTPGDGQGDYVISVKRRSFGEYQRNLFDGDSIHLQNEINNVRAELQTERSKVSALENELGTIREQMGGQADTPITSSAQYSEFTDDDASQISAALIMSSISIALWAVAAAFVAFRMFNRPNKDVPPEVMNGGSGHGAAGAMNGGSGHGASARTAAKHSAVMEESDMVA